MTHGAVRPARRRRSGYGAAAAAQGSTRPAAASARPDPNRPGPARRGALRRTVSSEPRRRLRAGPGGGTGRRPECRGAGTRRRVTAGMEPPQSEARPGSGGAGPRFGGPRPSASETFPPVSRIGRGCPGPVSAGAAPVPSVRGPGAAPVPAARGAAVPLVVGPRRVSGPLSSGTSGYLLRVSERRVRSLWLHRAGGAWFFALRWDHGGQPRPLAQRPPAPSAQLRL